MRCPFCHADDDKVIDSRSRENGRSIRRRRECLACHRRFTTYESVEDAVKLTVIKRDGSRVPYDRDKIFNSIRQAAYKRPVSAERQDQATNEVEELLITRYEKEVSSHTIGEHIAAVLRRVDPIAYIKFASDYRRFEDIGDLIEEAQDVAEQHPDIPGQGNLFEGSSES
jgi:transcriptional repressor NrdR